MLSFPLEPARAARLLLIAARMAKPRALGGPGSGNFGHAGRPGQVGGSADDESAREPLELDDNGEPRWQTSSSGKVSVLGISEDRWTDWAHESDNINDLLSGEDPGLLMDSTGSELSKDDITDLKKTGELIQAAAESHAVAGSLWRGESATTLDEALSRYKRNEIITLNRLTAAATEGSIAAIYAEEDRTGKKDNTPIILRIQRKGGTLGIQTLPDTGVFSGEVVMPKGETFRVHRIVKPNSATYPESVRKQFGIPKNAVIVELYNKTPAPATVQRYKPWTPKVRSLGDYPGHPFHGNQYTDVARAALPGEVHHTSEYQLGLAIELATKIAGRQTRNPSAFKQVLAKIRELPTEILEGMLEDYQEQRHLGGPGSGNFDHAGRPGEIGGSAPSGTEHFRAHDWTQPTDRNGRPIPIKAKDLLEAVALVHAGKVVEVASVKDAHTLIRKLADVAREAKTGGREAKDYDLCQVTVPNSNMFCTESLRSPEYPRGVPRLEMPQLAGPPVPGSQAEKDLLPGKKSVDGADRFITHLKQTGIETTREHLPASNLRASQRELVGSKVADMMLDLSFDPAAKPIFISSDDYVVDGHHRWAAVVGRDAEDGKLGDSRMKVIRVDAPISEVLHLANDWSKKYGIKQKVGHKLRGAGDYEGHPFRGNQWTPGAEPSDVVIHDMGPSYKSYPNDKERLYNVEIKAEEGHIRLWKTADKVAVDDVFVKKEYRGEGFGKGMYEEALKYAISQGYSGIVSTGTMTPMARRVWESFKKEGRVSENEDEDLVLSPRKRVLGGQGSGNFGHAGRPGEVGGSLSDEHSALNEFVERQKRGGPPPKTEEEHRQQALADKQTSPLAHPPFVMGQASHPGVIRYVAAYGEEHTAAPLPENIERGQMGECYKNASLCILTNPEMDYAEGFAQNAKTGDFVFQHAWAVTKDGTVVDPTWDNPEKNKYFGVRYDRAKYLKYLLTAKVYGVLGSSDKNARKTIETGGKRLRKQTRSLARHTETALHRAANKHESALRKVVASAFTTAKRSARLQDSPAKATSVAITALRDELEDALPEMLRKIYLEGGRVGVEILNNGLRAAEFNPDQPRDENGRWTDGSGGVYAKDPSLSAESVKSFHEAIDTLPAKVKAELKNKVIQLVPSVEAFGHGHAAGEVSGSHSDNQILVKAGSDQTLTLYHEVGHVTSNFLAERPQFKEAFAKDTAKPIRGQVGYYASHPREAIAQSFAYHMGGIDEHKLKFEKAFKNVHSTLGEHLRKFGRLPLRTAGDFEGHPFRGNQWTVGEIGPHGEILSKGVTAKGKNYTISGRLTGPAEGYSAHYTVTKDEDGSVIAQADMHRDNDYLSIVGVHSQYQRQGIGTALYAVIEKHTGKILRPSPDNVSDKAKGLWRKRRSLGLYVLESKDLRTAKRESKPKFDFVFNAKTQAAIDWADRHAAELIDNITDTSREAINNATAEFLETGDWNDYKDEILAAVGDEERADRIARNEPMVAVHEGQREAWNQAVDEGLLSADAEREWIVVGDERVCKICESLEGKRSKLGESYEGSEGEEYSGPPAHVLCRCSEGIV